MENKYNYLTTFRYYNWKGQRLSIFGRIIGEKMSIVAIPCSKKDQFNKKTGRNLYETNIYKQADVNIIDITSSGSKKEFINFCRENYYRPVMVDVQMEMLVCGKTDGDLIQIANDGIK